MALISAHRSGAGSDTALENTRTAMEKATGMDGVSYVEFDVQRCKDGTLVLFHDDTLLDGTPIGSLTFDEFSTRETQYLLYTDALRILKGRKKAHIDLKFVSPCSIQGVPWEIPAVQEAIDTLGVDNMIVTTMEDRSVKIIRSWSRDRYPDLLVGLSLGRDIKGMGRLQALWLRLGELFPGRRFRRCKANLMVANKWLANATLRRFARSHRMPLLVWTVDGDEELKYWLSDPDTWLVTTNFPEKAVEIRSRV